MAQESDGATTTKPTKYLDDEAEFREQYSAMGNGVNELLRGPNLRSAIPYPTSMVCT